MRNALKILCILLCIANLFLLIFLVSATIWTGYSDSPDQISDSLVAAIQIGRLDLVSVILTGLGLFLVVGGIFGYLHFEKIAEHEARITAERIAKEVAIAYTKIGGQESVETGDNIIDAKDLDFSPDATASITIGVEGNDERS